MDELPRLLNVPEGDLSLVGSRPLIADECENHGMQIRFGVYNIRHGVTGLAQILGRDLVSPADTVRWDVKYLWDFASWRILRFCLQLSLWFLEVSVLWNVIKK